MWIIYPYRYKTNDTKAKTLCMILGRGCIVFYLTRWDRDEMNKIAQTIISNMFSSIKIFEFRLKFHWNLFLGAIDNIPALVRIMAWCWPGDKPLSDPMMVNLPTRLYTISSHWVNSVQWTMRSTFVFICHHLISCFSCINVRLSVASLTYDARLINYCIIMYHILQARCQKSYYYFIHWVYIHCAIGCVMLYKTNTYNWYSWNCLVLPWHYVNPEIAYNTLCNVEVLPE